MIYRIHSDMKVDIKAFGHAHFSLDLRIGLRKGIGIPFEPDKSEMLVIQ